MARELHTWIDDTVILLLIIFIMEDMQKKTDSIVAFSTGSTHWPLMNRLELSWRFDISCATLQPLKNLPSVDRRSSFVRRGVERVCESASHDCTLKDMCLEGCEYRVLAKRRDYLSKILDPCAVVLLELDRDGRRRPYDASTAAKRHSQRMGLA
jgi:hypothetical protein